MSKYDESERFKKIFCYKLLAKSLIYWPVGMVYKAEEGTSNSFNIKV